MEKKGNIDLILKMVLMTGALMIALASFAHTDVLAAETLKVEILSPEKIESVPIYEGDMEIAVTNLSDTTQSELNCFLTVVDEDRMQSFPMDEFEPDSYQTRKIASLQPGETATLTIPLRVMYVGNFQLVANVVDYASGSVYAAPSLRVCMISNTNLHRGLVIGVSAVMPVLLAAMTVMLGKKRGRRKKTAD